MRDDLLHWWRARADHEAAARHRLEEGPRQDERIGQVNMDRRFAQQRKIVPIGNASEKADAREIDLAFELAQQPLAVGLARRQARRVAHRVAADDDDARLRPAALDLRNRAHEYVEATVGLGIPRDLRNEFFLRALAGANG